MKKTLLLLATAFLALASVQTAQADDPWFSKWDHDHDGHWNWEEFRKAHRDWYRHHRDEKALTDAELRAEFDRRAAAHHGWVGAEEVRDFHHW